MCTKFKATEQFFPSMAELIMLYKMVLTFESVEEILTILSRGTVYYSVRIKELLYFQRQFCRMEMQYFLFVDRPNTG